MDADSRQVPIAENNRTGTPELSAETERRLALLFALPHQEFARKILLDECGNNLPFLGKLDAAAMDRFRFAALKLSCGNPDRLLDAVGLAKTDWRDLLVAAGFAERIDAHISWLPDRTW
jgi:hypothetical protein